MKPDPAKLLKEALKLSPEERAALAASLLESLEDAVDEDVEAAWATEIVAIAHARRRPGYTWRTGWLARFRHAMLASVSGGFARIAASL
jgi:hypothetical protein